MQKARNPMGCGGLFHKNDHNAENQPEWQLQHGLEE